MFGYAGSKELAGSALLSHHHEGVRQYTARFLIALAHEHSAAHHWLLQLLISNMPLADSKHHFCGLFYDVFANTVKDMSRQSPQVQHANMTQNILQMLCTPSPCQQALYPYPSTCCIPKKL